MARHDFRACSPKLPEMHFENNGASSPFVSFSPASTPCSAASLLFYIVAVRLLPTHRPHCLKEEQAQARNVQRMDHGEALVKFKRSNSSGGRLSVCTDAAARANLFSSRCDRPDCAEGEGGSGEVPGPQMRSDHHGRGRPRWPRAAAGNLLPGWCD